MLNFFLYFIHIYTYAHTDIHIRIYAYTSSLSICLWNTLSSSHQVRLVISEPSGSGPQMSGVQQILALDCADSDCSRIKWICAPADGPASDAATSGACGVVVVASALLGQWA